MELNALIEQARTNAPKQFQDYVIGKVTHTSGNTLKLATKKGDVNAVKQGSLQKVFVTIGDFICLKAPNSGTIYTAHWRIDNKNITGSHKSKKKNRRRR